MYLEHFGLCEHPFELVPDSDFLYMSDGHRQAKAYMDYTVWNRDGFVVITGEIGSGKTTLIEKLMSELSESVVVAKVFQTQLDEVEFLQAVLVEFGLHPFNAKKVELLDMLNTFLMNEFMAGKQLVLIIDDAHNLSRKTLEEIRLLSGLETHKEKVLHVILVGQPQLNQMLETPELEQLLQRVRLRYHLSPLSLEQLRAYINFRLEIAGRTTPPLFADDVFEPIYEYTGGVPRLINALCDTCLVCAYADDEPKVTLEVLKTAIAELKWVPYAQRPVRRPAEAPSITSGDSAADALREHTQALRDVTRQLDQFKELAPTLASISTRMAGIESHLRRLAGTNAPDNTQPANETQGGWTDAGAEKAILNGSRRKLAIGTAAVLLLNVNGTLHAVGSHCPHDGTDLAESKTENGEIICPVDGSRFSLKTGVAPGLPAREPLAIFPVRVRKGRVQVQIRTRSQR